MRYNSRRRKKILGFDNLECRRLLSVTPNDTYFAQQWGLNNANNVDIDAPEAWSLNTGSPSVVVAVIGPTGVDATNPDLANRLWTNPTPNSDPRYPNSLHGWNFDTNSPNTVDTNGHDTNVAGIIAAQANNGQGIAGVTWGSPLMDLEASSIYGMAAAVDFAVAHGAKVINMSVGYGESPTFFPNDVLYQAIQRASSSGVVVVAAAGNGGVTGSTGLAGQDLGILASQSYTVAPASYRLPNMISVASVDSSGNLSNFSNYGASMVDLAAPGEMIETTGLGNGYISWAGGTSFAAPYVTGVVALVMSQHPEYTVQQVVQTVNSTTKPLPSLAGKTISGGMVDAYNALLAGLPAAPSNLSAKANGSNEIDLTWAASSSTFTTGYKIQRSTDGVNWTQLSLVPTTTTSYQDIGISGSSQRSYRVIATSTYAGDSISGTPVDVTTTAGPSGNVGIDAGGGASGVYAADTGFSGGSLYADTAVVDTSAVTDPAPQSVYQTERYGNFTYSVPGLTPGGSYNVRLDFAEIFFNYAGQRVFNVAINGKAVLKNFDIVATTGGIDRAIAYTFPATADPSGSISITFTSIVNNAKVSSIHVTPNGSSVVAIDAGGGASGLYAVDTGFSGGSLYSASAAIDTSAVTDPAPQSVYQTERYGTFTYSVPGLTPGGACNVRLDFAEIFYSYAGQRVFNVAINGATVLKNFDIVATTGGIDRAIAYTFPATANASGSVTITFTSIVDNAKISGIRVTPGTTLTAKAPVDLAKGKPTYSSTIEGPGYTSASAVDGISTTRWSSGQWMQSTNIGWMYVDLGATTTINEVALNWEAAYGVNFQIQVSNDATSWTNLKTVTGNASAGWQDYTGLNGIGRYVRIYCTKTNATSNYSLYDLNVF